MRPEVLVWSLAFSGPVFILNPVGHPLCFWIAGSLALLASLGVILARSPLYSALSLGGTLLATAALFISLSAHLAGAIQVMVYAGAILVLVIFTIMLLNLRNDPGEKPLSLPLLAGGGIVAVVFFLAVAAHSAAGRPGEPAAVGAEFGSARSVGLLLFGPGSRFVYPFELVSVLLLAALVGAIALGRKSQKEPS